MSFNYHVVYLAEKKDGGVIIESMDLRSEINAGEPNNKEFLRGYISGKGDYRTIIFCKIEEREYVQESETVSDSDKLIADAVYTALNIYDSYKMPVRSSHA